MIFRQLSAQRRHSRTQSELHEQFMTVRLDEIKQLKAAWNDLYGQLSDDQKKEADGVVIPMMGMGMDGGPGMGWRGR